MGFLSKAWEDTRGSVNDVAGSVVPEFKKAWTGAQYSAGNTWDGFRKDMFGMVADLTGQTPKRPPGPVGARPVALRGTDDTPEDSSMQKDDSQLRAFAEAGKTVAANPLVGDGTIGQGSNIAARAPLGRNMLIGN